MMNKITKRSGPLRNVADRCVRLSPKELTFTDTYKGQVVVPLDASFFPLLTIPPMAPFQVLPTRFVLGNPATALGDSVSQFDTSAKPEGYWSSSQVGGLVHKVVILMTNLLRS